MSRSICDKAGEFRIQPSVSRFFWVIKFIGAKKRVLARTTICYDHDKLTCLTQDVGPGQNHGICPQSPSVEFSGSQRAVSYDDSNVSRGHAVLRGSQNSIRSESASSSRRAVLVRYAAFGSGVAVGTTKDLASPDRRKLGGYGSW
jgi:hypothetical protein